MLFFTDKKNVVRRLYCLFIAILSLKYPAKKTLVKKKGSVPILVKNWAMVSKKSEKNISNTIGIYND
jgi:hypothetical protein